jgi:hypothetical protein
MELTPEEKEKTHVAAVALRAIIRTIHLPPGGLVGLLMGAVVEEAIKVAQTAEQLKLVLNGIIDNEYEQQRALELVPTGDGLSYEEFSRLVTERVEVLVEDGLINLAELNAKIRREDLI